MDNNQITNLRTTINNIKDLNVDELVSLIFKDQDIENIKIGQFSIAEYISHL
jgi:hypothetical protein